MSQSRNLIKLTLVLVFLHNVKIASSCLCLLIKNFQCPAPPTCCESGQYTFDECGCCMKCAKAELQTCGGASDISGKCADGLQCLKTCLPCKTVGDRGKPCIFPFKYEDRYGVEYEYHTCTTKDADNGQPWCATEVDVFGFVVDNSWGDCLEGCPGTRVECDDKYFSIQEGKCIDVSVPGAIPNWFGAPTVKLEEANPDLFPAPVCQSKGKAKRLYENTCRCSRGKAALDFDLHGNPRGNCTGLEDNAKDNLDKVWCFLENIRDPRDPQSGCYSDTQWSERDGRYWSALACSQAPDIHSNTGKTAVWKPRPRISNNNIRGRDNTPDTTVTAITTTLSTTTTTITTTTSTTPTTGPPPLNEYDDDLSEYYYDSDVEEATDKNTNRFTFFEEITTEAGVTSRFRAQSRNTLSDEKEGRRGGVLAKDGHKGRSRPGRPRLADPRRHRNQSLTTTAVSLIHAELPVPPRQFRRKPHSQETGPRKKKILQLLPDIQENTVLEDLKETPRSFLEGEFGEQNIPLAIPLYFDEVFQKIPKSLDGDQTSKFDQFEITNLQVETE